MKIEILDRIWVEKDRKYNFLRRPVVRPDGTNLGAPLTNLGPQDEARSRRACGCICF